MEQAIASWDGEATVVGRHPSSGSWFVVAVHSTVLGPAAGGCRMRPYPSLEAAVVDAHRLSSAMTRKFALCDVPLGGGKSVIAVPRLPSGPERADVLHAFAHLLESLGGLYSTAPDMNTSSEDMDVIGEVTSHVFCRTPERGGSGSTAPATAEGVYHAIRATVGHLDGEDDVEGRRFVVQGVGAVGALLATRLAAAGAVVTVADVDAARAAEVAAAVSGRAVDPGAALAEPCDVLAPCAAGGVLTADTIPRLACRAVVGAANNQLGEPDDARRLHEAGVLWGPDYVVNSGGVLHGAGLELLGWTDGELADRLAGLGRVVSTIYAEAERDGTTPLAVAEAMAAARLTR